MPTIIVITLVVLVIFGSSLLIHNWPRKCDKCHKRVLSKKRLCLSYDHGVRRSDMNFHHQCYTTAGELRIRLNQPQEEVLKFIFENGVANRAMTKDELECRFNTAGQYNLSDIMKSLVNFRLIKVSKEKTCECLHLNETAITYCERI